MAGNGMGERLMSNGSRVKSEPCVIRARTAEDRAPWDRYVLGHDHATFAHKSGGGVSLREGPLQRCYRDIHAATQHILLSDQIMQDAGRVLLGMAPEDARWTTLGLVAGSA